MIPRFPLVTVSIATSLCFVSFSYADQCKPDCGFVTHVSHYKQEGQGSGLGAVAGGVAGGLLGHQIGKGTGNTIATIGGAAGGAYAGHVIEKKVKAKNMTRVSVKFDNGHTQDFDFEEGKGQFAQGTRVQIRNGQLTRYQGK